MRVGLSTSSSAIIIREGCWPDAAFADREPIGPTYERIPR